MSDTPGQVYYHATAQKAGAVIAAATGRLGSEECCFLSHGNRVGVYTSSEWECVGEFGATNAILVLRRVPLADGRLGLFSMNSQEEFSLSTFERVQADTSVSGRSGDHLERRWHPLGVREINFAHGSIKSAFYRRPDRPFLCASDDSKPVVALIAHDRVVHFFDFAALGSSASHPQRRRRVRDEAPIIYTGKIEERNVDAICVTSTSCLRLHVLFSDRAHRKHVATYELNDEWALRRQGQVDIAPPRIESVSRLNVCDLERQAESLVATCGGLVVVGPSQASFFRLGDVLVHERSVSFGDLQDTQSTVGTPIASRVVDAVEHDGFLYVTFDTGVVMCVHSCDGRLTKLGVGAIPTCLVANRRDLFVGSSFGSSYTLNLATQSQTTVIQNHGPLVALSASDEKNERATVLASCGAGKNGGLSLFRGGISVHKDAELCDGLAGVVGITSLAQSGLALNYETQTVILQMDSDSDLIQTDRSAIDGSSPVLSSCVLTDAPNYTLAVTATSVICAAETGVRWDVPVETVTVSAVDCRSASAAFARGKNVSVLTFDVAQRTQTTTLDREFENDVSCLAFCTWVEAEISHWWVLIGFWGCADVVALNLNGPAQHPVTVLSVPTLPRSLAVLRHRALQPDTPPLFTVCAGCDDGSLHTASMTYDDGVPAESQRLELVDGTACLYAVAKRPLALRALFAEGCDPVAIICCGDTPSVCHLSASQSGHVRLQVTNLGLADLLDCAHVGDGVAFLVGPVLQPSLILGSLGKLANVNVSKCGLNVPVSQITFHATASVFVVALSTADGDTLQLKKATSGNTLEDVEKGFRLHEQERCTALGCFGLGSPAVNFVVAGTGFFHFEEPAPQNGRLLVFGISTDSPSVLRKAFEKEVKGAAYCVCQASQGRVLVGVNGAVELYRWAQSELSHESTLRLGLCNVAMAPWFSTDGSASLYLVADSNRSVSALSINPLDGSLELWRRDAKSRCLIDICVSGTDVLCSDVDGRVTSFSFADVAQELSQGQTQTSKLRFQEGSVWQTGDRVISFQRASLASIDVAAHPFVRADETTPLVEHAPVIIGTTLGSIATLLPLSRSCFRFLLRIELAVREVLQLPPSTSRGFVDGDVVEKLLDLTPGSQDRVATIVRGSITAASRAEAEEAEAVDSAVLSGSTLAGLLPERVFSLTGVEYPHEAGLSDLDSLVEHITGTLVVTFISEFSRLH